MIVGHHAGENVLLLAAATGAGGAPLLLLYGRVRFGELLRRLRRRLWT